MTSRAVELAAELVRFDTINPPGNEGACTERLASMLEAAGFACEMVPLEPGRPNLVARLGGAEGRKPIALTGHTDTVPLGLAPWSVPPHGGLIKDGRLWGRGASDMKSGTAAIVVAAVNLAEKLKGTPGVVLYITAGEEVGVAGAAELAKRGMAGEAGALVVAEPTSNRPLCGHKGAFWAKAITKGVTAHGSMPDQGVNAVYKAAKAVSKLETFGFNVARHPVMGAPSLNVGFVHGGLNVNSVPDRAEIGIDIRTIPGQDIGRLNEELQATLGSEVTLEVTVEAPSVWTDPEDPFLVDVFAVCRELGHAPKVEAAPYFTDASALTPALGNVPTVILGPGPAHMAHQTDEWCDLDKIDEAVTIYERLIARWCGI